MIKLKNVLTEENEFVYTKEKVEEYIERFCYKLSEAEVAYKNQVDWTKFMKSLNPNAEKLISNIISNYWKLAELLRNHQVFNGDEND
jgi:hypothetical protein